MKTHDIIFNNKRFVVFEYAQNDYGVYYKHDGTLYDENNGFPSNEVTVDYLHVQEFWRDLI